MPEKQSRPPQDSPSLWRKRIISFTPFLLTALVSVLLSLFIQALLFPDPHVARLVASPTPTSTTPSATGAVSNSTTPREQVSPTPAPTSTRAFPMRGSPSPRDTAGPRTSTPVPTVSPRAEQSPSPLPTMLKLDEQEEQIREDMREIQTEIRNLWSAYYLARAASQLADAEAALRINDLDEVRQVLVTVDVSLDFAYERSNEQHKGPISEFRLQVSKVYEELYIRPEHMDQRLRRLRQSMLSLVDEGQ